MKRPLSISLHSLWSERCCPANFFPNLHTLTARFQTDVEPFRTLILSACIVGTRLEGAELKVYFFPRPLCYLDTFVYIKVAVNPFAFVFSHPTCEFLRFCPPPPPLSVCCSRCDNKEVKRLPQTSPSLEWFHRWGGRKNA